MTQQVFDYAEDEFDAFARAKTPAGLNIPDGFDGVIRICHAIKSEDSNIALELLRTVIPAEPVQKIGKGEAGPGRGKKTGDNVTRLSERGNSETYLLRRLKRDYPALADQVYAIGVRRPQDALVAVGRIHGAGGFVRLPHKRRRGP